MSKKYCSGKGVQDAEGLKTLSELRLPHIPPKIWQIYLADSCAGVSDLTLSWITNSPTYSYSVVGPAGAQELVARLTSYSELYQNALPTYHGMTRRVMRADFLRYLLLALDGGVYSDIDTELIQPLHKWVPSNIDKAAVKLIIGLESDESPPVRGTTYEVQFSQWTLAGAKGHPVFWAMVNRILRQVADKTQFDDHDVLDVSGPAGWTEVIYAHLSKQAGRKVTWHDFHNNKEPQLLGDTLVLPIDAFGTGLRHSGANTRDSYKTMVKHYFAGTWRGGVL